jgi:hypothetical protein
VRDFLRRYRETNEITAKPQGGDRRSKIKGEDEELLDLLGNKKETESVHSKDFIISYPLSSIQIEVP